jgi:hypothetical protein
MSPPIKVVTLLVGLALIYALALVLTQSSLPEPGIGIPDLR